MKWGNVGRVFGGTGRQTTSVGGGSGEGGDDNSQGQWRDKMGNVSRLAFSQYWGRGRHRDPCTDNDVARQVQGVGCVPAGTLEAPEAGMFL